MSDVKDPFRLAEEIRESEAARIAKLKGKFEAGEHQWLGMRGAAAACEALKKLGVDIGSFQRLRRRAGDVELSYGEIVALSGDFYGSPEALFEERPPPWAWLTQPNDLGQLRKLFAAELSWIEAENRATTAGYPNNTLGFWWNAKSYLELAEDNTDHFGWHNMLAYCRHHQRALEYARDAATRGSNDENWLRALYWNGFSDHFLTDGFAAGHIRVPRAEIRTWATRQGYSPKLAGLLSKVLHDQDGHVHSVHAEGEAGLGDEEGLAVENAKGDRWYTRCDGQLFLVSKDATAPLIAEPIAAVAASLVELFTAQAEKQLPPGNYAALKHVPFPRRGEPGLSDKFRDVSQERIGELLDSFTWYTKLPFIEASLDKQNIAALFAALPDLMQEFRNNVARDCEKDLNLKRRLPERYIEGFLNIG
ncbi:MAG TPA: hypothetical protein VG937_21640 [Polyangiaceae bacterium]|nr:hypothetical protein [Polyangiaceae bacterium]